MKSFASRISLVLTVAILSAATMLFNTSRLEYCGQPDALRPRSDTGILSETAMPTLAPPQKVVFVQVESDRPDLEIGWVDN